MSFHAVSSKQAKWCRSMKPETDRAGSGFSLYISTMLGDQWSTFCRNTMTGDHYTGTVLAKVVAAVQEQWQNMGTARTLLLHDSAAPFVVVVVVEGEKLHVLPHSACTPDLAPCDSLLLYTLILKTGLAAKNCFWRQHLAKVANSQLHVQHLPNMAEATATLCGPCFHLYLLVFCFTVMFSMDATRALWGVIYFRVEIA